MAPQHSDEVVQIIPLRRKPTNTVLCIAKKEDLRACVCACVCECDLFASLYSFKAILRHWSHMRHILHPMKVGG